MGVLNATPDSFSDGGRHPTLEDAAKAGLRLVEDGADVLDVGGESTRPGAAPVAPDKEAERVLSLIRALKARTTAVLSIDTRRTAVAAAALAAGAEIWNDVSALSDAGALELAARSGCKVILMHMQGEPQTMQVDPFYLDVEAEVRAFLLRRAAAAIAAGVRRDRILLDPGIGFGKTTAHNLILLQRLPRLVAEGFPVVVGASRKGFIKALDPLAGPPQTRLGGSIAAALAAARAGCAMVRCHDVRETRQALLVDAAVRADGRPPP
jgi:dihydropteroate synthase